MKKIIISILIIIITIIIIITVKISENGIKSREVSNFNLQFEDYKDKTLYGADVLSVINKAVDNNDSHNIEKNDEGYYIEDDKYSVKVEIILLSKDEEGNIKEVQRPMEALQKARVRWIYKKFLTYSF